MAEQAAGGPALAISVTDSTRPVIQSQGCEAEEAAGGPALALSVNICTLFCKPVYLS